MLDKIENSRRRLHNELEEKCMKSISKSVRAYNTQDTHTHLASHIHCLFDRVFIHSNYFHCNNLEIDIDDNRFYLFF